MQVLQMNLEGFGPGILRGRHYGRPAEGDKRQVVHKQLKGLSRK